jgi:rubredoxin
MSPDAHPLPARSRSEADRGDLSCASWYLVDGQDRLLDLCGEWDQVASTSGASAAVLRAQALGQPLSRYITGDVTRMYMEALLQSCRLSGRERRLSYRCDTPAWRRTLEMHLQPLAQDLVRVDHRILSVQPAAARQFPRASPAAPARPFWRCSICLRVQDPDHGEWVDHPAPTAAPGGAVPHYTVCPRCAGQR